MAATVSPDAEAARWRRARFAGSVRTRRGTLFNIPLQPWGMALQSSDPQLEFLRLFSRFWEVVLRLDQDRLRLLEVLAVQTPEHLRNVTRQSIADHLKMTPQGVSKGLDKLEERDLIRRVPYPSQIQERHIEMTQFGAEVAAHSMRLHHRAIGSALPIALQINAEPGQPLSTVRVYTEGSTGSERHR